MAGAARRDPRGGAARRLRRRARHVHDVLRRQGARRGAADAAGARLPAGGRPAHGGHGAGDRARAAQRRVRHALHAAAAGLPRRAAAGRGRVPGVLVLAGRQLRDAAAPRRRAGALRAAARPCATTSGCSRRSTTRRPAARWATSRRPSAMCRSSRPRARSAWARAARRTPVGSPDGHPHDLSRPTSGGAGVPVDDQAHRPCVTEDEVEDAGRVDLVRTVLQRPLEEHRAAVLAHLDPRLAARDGEGEHRWRGRGSSWSSWGRRSASSRPSESGRSRKRAGRARGAAHGRAGRRLRALREGVRPTGAPAAARQQGDGDTYTGRKATASTSRNQW